MSDRGSASAALAAAGLLALLAGCAATPVGHAELQLFGIWRADEDSCRSGCEGVSEMDVTGAADDGTAFDGVLHYRTQGGDVDGALHAELTPRGHLAGTVGTEASIEVHIVDGRTLDYCLVAYGEDPSFSCGRLVRED